MNIKITNYPENKIPSAKKHQRSSSIPISKNLDKNANNILKPSREISRERSRPVSRNIKNLYEERNEQTEKLENEISKLEKENSILFKRNNDFELYLDKLKENNLNAQRLKTNLTNKFNRIKKEIEFSQREFEMFKNVKEFKINIVNNNIQYAKNIKEDRKNSFAKKIESELLNGKRLEKDLKETRDKIKKMRMYLNKIQDKKNKSADKIFKEKHEMERFLINI